MLLQDAAGILHRHVIAGEWHHACSKFNVQPMQRRAFQRRCRLVHRHRDTSSPRTPATWRKRQPVLLNGTNMRGTLIRPTGRECGAPSVLMTENRTCHWEPPCDISLDLLHK